jgi:hypothetical protein
VKIHKYLRILDERCSHLKRKGCSILHFRVYQMNSKKISKFRCPAKFINFGPLPKIEVFDYKPASPLISKEESRTDM